MCLPRKSAAIALRSVEGQDGENTIYPVKIEISKQQQKAIVLSKQLGDRTEDKLKVFTSYMIWKMKRQRGSGKKIKQLIEARRNISIKWHRTSQLAVKLLFVWIFFLFKYTIQNGKGSLAQVIMNITGGINIVLALN